MTAVSLFAGIGGFDLALERLGHQIIWANEFDRYAADIYDTHFRRPVDRRDITTVPARDIPSCDLLCGGFPCQAFSIAGRRQGFDDTRGTLFFDIARICRERRPRYLLLENVKGLTNHDNGQTFRTIIATLDELGYDLQWQVCNSKDFGVPQNRERVFIVGHLRGEPRPEVFPIRQHGSIDTEKGKPVFSTVRATYPRNWNGDYIDTDTTYRQAQETFTGLKIRRLTPLECERLQGFPDGWTAQGINGAISDTQRYKTLGNAVTVNVVQEIASRLSII